MSISGRQMQELRQQNKALRTERDLVTRLADEQRLELDTLHRKAKEAAAEIERLRRNLAALIGKTDTEIERLEAALKAIVTTEPERVSPSRELTDAIASCPNCLRAKKDKWPPSGLCESHYCAMSRDVYQQNEHYRNNLDIVLRRIATAALRGEVSDGAVSS